MNQPITIKKLGTTCLKRYKKDVFKVLLNLISNALILIKTKISTVMMIDQLSTSKIKGEAKPKIIKAATKRAITKVKNLKPR